MIFPWQLSEWQQLQQTIQANRLPHALLFSGIAGTGKKQFADEFSKSLLCRDKNPEGYACGHCHACHLVKGRAHPNLYWVEPEKEGGSIKVDQIREMNEFVYQSSFEGEFRVVIIYPAHTMNMNAANALLKTLEEPSSGAIIILVADEVARLAATILSRCQKVIFTRPSETQALNWLKESLPTQENAALLLSLSNGAPLAAKNLAESDSLALRQTMLTGLTQLTDKQFDPIQLASKLQAFESLQFIDFFLNWLSDLLKLQLQVSTSALTNLDFQSALISLRSAIPTQKIIDLNAYLLQLRKQIGVGINFNKPLLMEDILFRWMRCAS